MTSLLAKFADYVRKEFFRYYQWRLIEIAGTFQSDIKRSERAETEEAGEGKRKDVSEDEEEEAEKPESSVKKKRKLKNRDVCDEEEEQPGPSSRVTPRKRPEKIHFCKSPPTSASICKHDWVLLKVPLLKSNL